MACALVSTAVAYNSPAITTSCGTVFCSQTFEDFSINCTACSKDFNLLSCKLFIEHIKECLGSGIHKNSIIEDVKTVATTLDPLLCMKVEVEPPGCVEVTSFDHSEIKLECEDEEVGVEDEEVATRNVLDAIIVEYENHPLLWDEKLLKGATLKERTHHFNQITDVINSKFKADFTVSELRMKISNLRSGYMRAIKKSNRKLWYIDKMKYILGPSSVISCGVNVNEVAKPNLDSTEVPPIKMEISDDNTDESFNIAHENKTTNKRSRTPFNLNHQHIISDIIDLYKQHTLLWDPNAPLYKDANERKARFCQIAEFINTKYHLAVNGQEILRKIESLRTSYRRATQNSISSNKPIALWYYEQLSFISEKRHEELNLNCELPEQIHTDDVTVGEIDIPPDCESLNESLQDEVSIELVQSDDDFFDYERLNEDKEHSNTVISIITEFKKHPCLWKKEIYNITDSSIRLESLESVKDAVNSTCNKKFSLPTIRQMFGYLTNSYRRVLRDKEASEKDNKNEIFPIDLYYFDDISFIGSACSDVLTVEGEDSPAGSGDDDADDDEDGDSGSDEGPLLYRGLSTNNKKLVTCVIKEYQKEPTLWSIKEYSNNHFTRWDAYGRIAQAVNDTLNTNFTCKHMRGVIGRMRATHQRVSRLKQKNPNFKSDIWYIDLLSFIPSHDLDLEATGRSPKRSTVKSKDHLTAIIKHYKALPNLWDVNHSDYMDRNLRVKTLENLLAKINKEQACQLTIKELRYQIRFLKESYTRALCNETKEWITSKCPPKPFFFDQVSFLEPFVKPLTAPRIQLDARPDPNDDFTYLTDNQPLMISFINTYRQEGCLWDQNHRDMDNTSAQSDSYEKIINMFSENEVILTKDQVISAIAFLHATVVTTQRSSEHDDRVWFYEHLKFLGRIPGTCGKYCSHCGQHFSPSSEYEKHKIEIAGDFPYKCIACDIGFMTRSKYIYHKKTHKQPFKCEICDFRAYEKNNFKVHMLRHEGITPFPCTTCNRGFVTSTELKRHLLIHTGEKPFICYICGMNMRSNAELYQHLKRHRNQRDYKCTDCGRAFYTRKAMKTHMESHSDERNHVCDVCGATFKRKTTLRQHEAIHAEKKKHSCKICGNLFAQKAGLYSHMKVHNLNRE